MTFDKIACEQGILPDHNPNVVILNSENIFSEYRTNKETDSKKKKIMHLARDWPDTIIQIEHEKGIALLLIFPESFTLRRLPSSFTQVYEVIVASLTIPSGKPERIKKNGQKLFQFFPQFTEWISDRYPNICQNNLARNGVI
jgi:hypothetical protein